jgi:hypothetical protein
MQFWRTWLGTSALALVSASAVAQPLRSPALRAEFQRLEPCPATGLTRGACPGYEVDHAVPLCLGGQRVDTISNLQWLTIEAHRRKTAEDVRLCRLARTL